MQQNIVLEHIAGKDVIDELSKGLYEMPLEAYRELVSNAIDIGSKKVNITLTDKTIYIEDFGQGIQNINDFAFFGQSSKKGSEKDIGQKGLGKLSALRLGKRVLFLTNNGHVGYRIEMTSTEITYVVDNKNKVLNHTGTMIAINDLTEEVPTFDELASYLKKVFLIRIVNGLQIRINKILLNADDFDEHLRKEKPLLVGITGNIIEGEAKPKGSLDVYVKYVYITTIIIDPSRKFKGWVNCNMLKPTTNRNSLVREETYKKFITMLSNYVKQFPEYNGDNISNSQIMMGEQISKIVSEYILKNHINITGFGKGLGKQTIKGNILKTAKSTDDVNMVHEHANAEIDDEEVEERQERERDEQLKKKLDLTKKIHRITTDDVGLKYIYQSNGDSRPPLEAIDPNGIIINVTNSLYKLAMTDKKNLGPKYMRMLPYLVEVIMHFIPNIEKKNIDELYMKKCEITKEILNQREELKEFFT